MNKKSSQKQQATRILGSYVLSGNQAVVGELRIKGAGTLLKLHSDEMLAHVATADCIKGMSYTGEYLTLIDCRSPGVGHTSYRNSPTRYHADVFPHYVAIGGCHIDPSQSHISAIHFTTDDLVDLFYDFDAFSSVIDARPIIDTVLQERRQMRPVESGDCPQVLYFTGKDCLAEVSTAIGKISVHHRPNFSVGGPSGIYIKNRIVVSIEPERPVTFHEAVNYMYDVACFLSIAAGRVQGVNHIQITAAEIGGDTQQVLTVQPSYRWKLTDKSDQHKPHPGDTPLDPIRHRAEFEAVLSDWIERHREWRVARNRYLGCMRKVNRYGAERLVAAANVFDILPPQAVPSVDKISQDLAETRDACILMLRQHASGIDRDSALSVLRRFGKPSLPKKVAHRASIVTSRFGNRFSDLEFVARIAVKCRNFFVHGSSPGSDFVKLEPLIPFLTDALEFIFAASDLIDAGWDAERWNAEGHGWGHSFARFRTEYDVALAELKKATDAP